MDSLSGITELEPFPTFDSRLGQMAVEIESVEDVDDLFASSDESVEFPENVHF